MNQYENSPIVILCGGKGILLEQTNVQRYNKALVIVNNKPLIWWNLLHYASHGAHEFILAVGFQHEQFDRVLLEGLGAMQKENDASLYSLTIAERRCTVRVIQTPAESSTAQRLLACKPWLEQCDVFGLTYSDTLSDVDLSAEMAFHRRTGMSATLVAAQMPVRFRVLGMRQSEHIVRGFASKPVIQTAPINGGFYILDAAVLKQGYVDQHCTSLEIQPLEKLATEQKLGAFEHKGAWQHLDSERDLDKLTEVAKLIEHQKR